MEEPKVFELDEKLVSCACVQDDSMTIKFSLNKIKNGSRFSIGEYRQTSFPVDQHFNWFQKLMWKWLFGVKVEDYSEE